MSDTPERPADDDRDAAEDGRETEDETIASSPAAGILDESNPDPPEPSEPG